VCVLQECGLCEVRRRSTGPEGWLAMVFTWGGVQPFRVTARKAPPDERRPPAG
jgi:hypothetical protein